VPNLRENRCPLSSQKKRQPLWKYGEFLRSYLYMLIILINFIGVFNSMWIFRNTSLPNLKIGLPSLINIAFLWLAKVIRYNIISKSKKVKCTIVQALGLCTERTAHRGSRGIALLIHDHSTRRGWGVRVTPRPLFTRERLGTHCTGGWVDPRAGLDRCGKSRPNRDSMLGPSSP